jgi:energy-coupling factor transport system ATP-binding protein
VSASRSDRAHVELHAFGWRHAGRRAWAVRGVDLRIAHGERVLLLGPSGAGKSTLLAALGGLLAANSGEQEGSLIVGGSGVGVVFQDPQSQLVMARAGDDVAFGLENNGVPPGEIWPRVDEAFRAVAFPYGRDRRTEALSGGEQQRLALAGALATRPDLLLLDEPTANLDPDGATLVRTAVRHLLTTRQPTMVLVEHRVTEWLPLVDRVVVLAAGGGVSADGPPDTVFAEHGTALAQAGVWVPGPPPSPRPAIGPAGEALLEAAQVGFSHPGAARPAVSSVDVTVRANRALAVTGPNGSGKSTLALLLGGLLGPTHGRVRASPSLAGGEAELSPHRWRAATLASRIGSVFQNPEHQFLTSRVRDELALGLRRARVAESTVASTVDDLVDRLHLAPLANANPYTLSGGEQRRLSVATALATSPRVLVLDEPTFGQDRRTWAELVDLLVDLRREGSAIVAVTHDADFVRVLADETVSLRAGQALANPQVTGGVQS